MLDSPRPGPPIPRLSFTVCSCRLVFISLVLLQTQRQSRKHSFSWSRAGEFARYFCASVEVCRIEVAVSLCLTLLRHYGFGSGICEAPDEAIPTRIGGLQRRVGQSGPC